MPTNLDVVAADNVKVARSLVDLDRYPIETKDSPAYLRLIEQCREQLRQVGACVLPGFVCAEAVRELVEESTEMAPRAHRSEVTGNAYLTEVDESWSQDDPRRMVDTTVLGAVAYDQIPPTAKIRALYEWDTLMNFLADALGKEQLYRYADPMGALNVAVMKDGDYLRWHFDQTDFVTTLLLQSAEAGGDYEFVPMIRTNIKENHPQVKAILQGSTEGVIKLEITPGSLVLFEGRNSLHRVTRIKGQQLRLIALFGFDTKPGTVSSDYLRKIRYGRTEKVEA
ncbi:MAG TPA: hypothetical protein V6C69_11740 [Trichormus sp.]|jgi:hypothetical protein